MVFWFALIWFIGTSIVSALLAPRPKDAAGSSIGANQVPIAEEGASVPILLGTCKMSGPNVTWWGDLKIQKITDTMGGFLGIGAHDVTIGYKYFVGMQMGICCGPVDALEDIIIGGKSLKAAGMAFPIAYAADGVIIDINLPGLFGGDKQEGGIVGKVAFYFGSMTQPGDSYLAGLFGAIPGYRGICYAVLRQVYIGSQPYLKDWAWVLRSTPVPAGMSSGQANIDGDVNAAHGIVHVMQLDPEQGGMGLSSARFDLASFNSAATTLHAENLGISLQLDKAAGMDSWLGDICRTIDGVIFTDPSTGLWTLKLIRADYDPDTIPEFGVDEILDDPDLNVPVWPETLNKVTIRYLDRSQGFTIRTAQDESAANRTIQGVEAANVFDFMMVSNAALAQKIAGRELQGHSYPLLTGSLVLNRHAWSLRPGSPFKLTWPRLSIYEKCFRATNIRYGDFNKGEINVDIVEDIFSAMTSSYAPPSGSEWVDPLSDPVPVTQQLLVEAPYWVVGESRNVMALGVSGGGVTQSLDVYTNEGNGYLLTSEMGSPTPSGVLTAAWSAKTAAMDATGFTVGTGKDLDHLLTKNTNADGRNRGQNIALIGNEWVSWTTATDNGDGTYTISDVLRGALDSVPSDHALGDRVWFATEGVGLTVPTTSGGGGTGAQGETGEPGSNGTNGRSYIWHGAYDNAHSYVVDDTCSFGGSSYVSIHDGVGHQPDTSHTYWGIMAKAGTDGQEGVSTFNRTTSNVTTSSLVTNATENDSIPLCRVSDILHISTDYPAWVRLYGTSVARSNDSTRLITVDPLPGSGIFADVATTALNLAVDLSPVPVFVNGDGTPVDTGYLSIKNLDAQARAITVQLTHLPQEA